MAEIHRKSQWLYNECIDVTQASINDEGVVWPTIKTEKSSNLTCWTSCRGN